MPNFVTQIINKNADARYAVVLYGLEPEVVLDWTTDGLQARDVLKQVIAGNPNEFQVPPRTLIHLDVSQRTENCFLKNNNTM